MHELIELKGPTVVHASGVLNAGHREVFRGRHGASLRELAPRTSLPTVCVYNGRFALREDWDWIPNELDHVTYLTLPKGNNTSRQVLGVVLIVVGIFVPGAQALIYVGAALLASGLLPAPAFSPVTDIGGTAASPSPTYNISLSGNTARLGQAIPVPYGRHIIVPDFASQAYTEFDENDDQFYFALLSLGQLGNKFTLETTMIDDTELSHFEEVTTQLVGPGRPPLTLVHPCVVNAPEVASQDMEYAKYVGPFASCGPGLRAVKIGIDITCPRGLYFAEDDGTLSNKTIEWFVEARTITDSGAVSGTWKLLGSHTLTLSTNKVVRRTYTYTVTAGRYEVRLTRQDVRDDNARAGHDLQWLGMRSYLNKGGPVEPSATFLAIKIRATSQLSGLSQRRISCIVRRWLPVWNPDDGWLPEEETSNPAWAIADALRNPVYGGKVADNRIDLLTLYELSLIWEARGDEFNGIFDRRISLWAALTTIARVGRARPIMRASVFTFIRDAPQELPVALFNMRNIKRGSFGMEYNMLSDDTTDGLELSFFDEDTWTEEVVIVKNEDDNTITVLEEDSDEDPPVTPAKLSFMGITNRAQAEREALYTVADATYRRAVITFTTEMEGFLPCYGDLIAVAYDLVGWGVSGEIEEWDEESQTAIVTENLNWSDADSYAMLVDSQGDVYGPYLVQQGAEERSMVFMETPDPAVAVYTGTARERTRFAMGPADAYSRLCRIVAIVPQDNGEVQIRAVVEDARVHGDDDGGNPPPDHERIGKYGEDDVPEYDTASESERVNNGFYASEDLTIGVDEDPGYTYASD